MTSMVVFASIPIFFLLIAIEWWVDHRRGLDYMPFADAYGSLALGVWSITTKVLFLSLGGWLYLDVLAGYTLFSSIEMTPLTWIAAFVMYDFCYYWFHRVSHECNFFWASHVVHHQSEEYNLTTALRQTSSGCFGFIFYFPLYLTGFSPSVIATVGGINLVYQFWVHTRYINRLGWLDGVFVTPSNHRVHHGQNEEYIDKNHGGVFILWDRLFGTFQPEIKTIETHYGVTVPLQNLSPLGANFQVWRQMLVDMMRAGRWQDRLRLMFGRTGWRSEELKAAYPLAKTDVRGGTIPKYRVPLSAHMKFYGGFQLIAASVLGTLFALTAEGFTSPVLWLTWLIVSTPLMTAAAMLENRSNASLIEAGRIAVSLLIVVVSELSLSSELLLSYLLINGLILIVLEWSKRRSEHIKTELAND